MTKTIDTQSVLCTSPSGIGQPHLRPTSDQGDLKSVHEMASQCWVEGVFTALVTPFFPDGSFDEESFEALLVDQCSAGVSGVVLWGSTGEGPLLTAQEKHQQLKIATKLFSKRNNPPKLIINIGGSNTSEMLILQHAIERFSFDGVMVVTPPYVKPPIEGLIAHIQTASRTKKPILFYNIPGRTGRSLSPTEMKQLLVACPNITAIKESSGSLDMLVFLRGIRSQLMQPLACYIGDDPLFMETLKRELGIGVVSVMSNAIPAQWQCLTIEDEELFRSLNQIFSLIAAVPNPIGIKHVLYKLGLIRSNMCRLPLVPYHQCLGARHPVSLAQFEAAVAQLEAYR